MKSILVLLTIVGVTVAPNVEQKTIFRVDKPSSRYSVKRLIDYDNEIICYVSYYSSSPSFNNGANGVSTSISCLPYELPPAEAK